MHRTMTSRSKWRPSNNSSRPRNPAIILPSAYWRPRIWERRRFAPEPFLELWAIAPTPAKARQPRKSAIERLLKQHRIRRVDAETILRTLREPAIKVADGVSEAACIHMRSLVTRLHVVNHELREAEHKLDAVCTASGRGRLNIHDATGNTRMLDVLAVNVASTIMLLMAIEAMYPGKRLIHVFLDNTRYHHAKLVQQWLTRSGCPAALHPAILPASGPNRTTVGIDASALHPQQMLR